MSESVLIVGAGGGLSASLARLCSSKKMNVVLVARNIDKLEKLKDETKATTFDCDTSKIDSVKNLFEELDLKTLPYVDGFLYGFPCNDFSNVGETKGLYGKYGLEHYFDLKLQFPIYVIFENGGTSRRPFF